MDIGIRPSGSEGEQQAIAYARRQFERWGYQVEVQSFPVSITRGVLRAASLTTERPERREVRAVAFEGAATGTVSGRLLDAGAGRPEEFPPEAAGAIVLIQRRDVLFVEMARRAQEAGAMAVVVANKEPGLFPGELDPPADLPVIAIDQADGEALRRLLTQGSVEVSLSIGEEVTAHNVIARSEGPGCRTLSGGHLDSVPWAAGANDNASGAALVLELARATAAAGLGGHCFALFGGEETGLHGSVFFVSELSAEERDELDAYFNYDVVAGDATTLLMGSGELEGRARTIARAAGIEVNVRAPTRDIASDHFSFLKAGLPALMLTTPDFDGIHTAADTFENLEPAFLDKIAVLAFGLLRAFDGVP